MKHLQPNDSLKIIQEIINQRKQKYEENGFFFIFWGILISVAGITQFLMYQFDFHFSKLGFVWLILMPLGFIFTFVAKMREGIKAEKQGKSINWTGGALARGGNWCNGGRIHTIILKINYHTNLFTTYNGFSGNGITAEKPTLDKHFADFLCIGLQHFVCQLRILRHIDDRSFGNLVVFNSRDSITFEL